MISRRVTQWSVNDIQNSSAISSADGRRVTEKTLSFVRRPVKNVIRTEFPILNSNFHRNRHDNCVRSRFPVTQFRRPCRLETRRGPLIGRIWRVGGASERGDSVYLLSARRDNTIHLTSSGNRRRWFVADDGRSVYRVYFSLRLLRNGNRRNRRGFDAVFRKRFFSIKSSRRRTHSIVPPGDSDRKAIALAAT